MKLPKPKISKPFKKWHHQIFNGMLVVHLTHIGFAALKVDNLEAAVSFGAAAITLAYHLSKDESQDAIEEIRAALKEKGIEIKA